MIKQIFGIIWYKYLYHDFTGKQCKVIRITGWNSCLVDTPTGDRKHMWFLPFRWMK